MDSTPATEVPDDWINSFEECVRADTTARPAWARINQKGIRKGALLLLWQYACGAEGELKRMHRRASDASRKMAAAARAEEIARTSAPKRARDPLLFDRRAKEAREDAMRSEWPTPSDSVRTIAEELAVASTQKGRDISLDEARRAMVKAAGERSPVNPNYFLFLLWLYAKQHKIALGCKRLATLAGCADPSRELEEGTLARYFRSCPDSVRQGIAADFLPQLPPAET